MKIKFKHIAKGFGIGIGVLVAILIIALILLRLPFIQTQVAKIAIKAIFKESNAVIEVDKIAVNFIDNVNLKGIYVEDLKKDTMLYAENLEVDIAIFKLIGGGIMIDHVKLNNAVLNLEQNEDSTFNFQYILDAFPSDTSKEKKPIDLDAKNVTLNNVKANVSFLTGETFAKFSLLELKMNSLNVNDLLFDVSSLNIEDLVGYTKLYNNTDSTTVKPDTVEINNESVVYPLYGLPIAIKADNMYISNTDYFFQMGDKKDIPYFDANYVVAENLNLHFEEVDFDSTKIALHISELATILNTRKTIYTINGDLAFTESGIQAKDLVIKTDETDAKLSATLSYDTFNDLVSLEKDMNLSASFNHAKVAYNDIAYFVPSLDKNDFTQNFSSKAVILDGNIEGQIGNLIIDNLNVNAHDNLIVLNGKVKNLPKYQYTVFDDLRIVGDVDMQKLQDLLGEKIISDQFLRFERGQLNTLLNDSLNALQVSMFHLNTKGDLALDFSGTVSNVLTPNDLKYDLDVSSLQASYNDVSVFVDSLPTFLQNLDTIQYSGLLSGGIKQYTLDGQLQTALGNAITDVSLHFNQDFTHADYAGNIQLDTFNLGALLNSEQLGIVDFDMNVEGEGITLDSLNSSVKGNINTFEFNGYTYNDISINGDFAQREFNGKLNIEDENLDFNFNGRVDLNDSVPKVNFDAALQTINTQKLNFTSYPVIAQLNIDANIEGLKPKDLNGKIAITDITIKNLKESWSTDSILFVAEKGANYNTTFNIESDIIQAKLDGNYNIAKIDKIILSALDEYFPFSRTIELKDSAVHHNSEEEIHFAANVYNPDKLLRIFKLPVSELDSVNVRFDYIASSLDLDASVSIPYAKYTSFEIFDLNLTSDGNESILNNTLQIDSVAIASLGYLPTTLAHLQFTEQKGTLTLDVNNEQNLLLNALLNSENNRLKLTIQEPLVLDNKNWNYSQSEAFTLTKNNGKFPAIKLQNSGEAIELKKENETLSADFTQFNINNISHILELDSMAINGIIDGNANITMGENAKITGDLAINKLQLNDFDVGNISVKAKKVNNIIDGDVKIVGGENNLYVNANYNLDREVIDAKADIKTFKLATIEPFIKKIAKDIEGSIDGNIKINGPFNRLTANGKVNVNNVSAFVVPVGSSYMIDNGTIDFLRNQIKPNLTLRDTLDRTATLNGRLRHRNFQNIVFDLRFNTDGFTFLNSKKSNDLPFYGYLTAAADVIIRGNTELPRIMGKVYTNEADAVVQLLRKKSMARQEEYVIFMDGGDYTYQEIDSIAESRYEIDASIDLNLQIKIDDEALFKVVIDPLTGDNLRFRGTGDLALKLPPYGNIDITGIYNISEGAYRFSFQQLVRKNFELMNDSKITFAGDALNALLDVRAIYNTQATTVGLVKDELTTLSEEEASAYKRKTDVSVYLDIDGKLSSPKLSFDIQLDEADNSINSAASRALEKIKGNENELNKQVFSLLLFNSFVNTSGSSNISSTGTSTAVRSVSNLINTQLNRLTQNTKGLELNFALDQYEDQLEDDGSQITDIEFGLTQSLLDDRLTISVDGNVGLESGNENGALSNVAGDFVIRYKISKNGKYNVRVFQKSDYDALNESNVWKTGAGFSYQTQFGKLLNRKNDEN